MTRGQPFVTVVIPARYGSSRFPGKPLVKLGAKPLIQHVYERASACSVVSDVVVATDDERIRQAVEQFGGHVILMTGEYRTGTDRVAAVAKTLPGEYFVDLQGDEIPVNPDLLTDLIEPFVASGAEIGTLKRAIESPEDLQNPAVVKVVTDQQGRALYFSRAPIPMVREGSGHRATKGLGYIHLGVYSYRRAALLQFAGMPTGVLEDAEKLEQLRALEHGMVIRVWETIRSSLRVDTPDDAVTVAELLRQAEMASQDVTLDRAVPSR
jgi:3-deoxy-manno-octulosonate cytidylyltransferase (CMP-KDO synthetase)